MAKNVSHTRSPNLLNRKKSDDHLKSIDNIINNESYQLFYIIFCDYFSSTINKSSFVALFLYKHIKICANLFPFSRIYLLHSVSNRVKKHSLQNKGNEHFLKTYIKLNSLFIILPINI